MPVRLGSVRRPSPPSLGESTSLGSSCLKQKQMQDFGGGFLGAYDERMGRVRGFELFAASSFPDTDLKHPGVSALSTDAFPDEVQTAHDQSKRMLLCAPSFLRCFRERLLLVLTQRRTGFEELIDTPPPSIPSAVPCNPAPL
ncbi:hypothetical protein BV22DRAFT_1133676 [Leucogyrophana mollusca]|uniref:Uncharacterized protein n=1 Tax=Leucogyrophana mollusca TaxID=85980 RepID=A0ACB8B489_9AGAM|nr:hypothetical protein BV22DRAFT_1133676 [Leucogyrophana mollusca]